MPVPRRSRSFYGSVDDAVRKAEENMKTILICLALMFAQKQTAPSPPPSDLKFTVRLDRTAVWVGDQFHYLIIVDSPATYEFVLDNLTKDGVNMDPFQVLDVRTNPAIRDNGTRRLFVDM